MNRADYPQKRVDALKIGDFLPATKSTVVGVNHSGLSVPAGKVELTIRDVKGRVTIKHWDKTTLVSVGVAPTN